MLDGVSTLWSETWLPRLQPLLHDPRLPWWLLGATLLLCALLVVLWRRARGRWRRANRGRQHHAQRAESEAERFLAQQGYAILDRQLSQAWRLRIDDRWHTVGCRADLLLRRRGRLYIADVKTGGKAPDPRSPATRRQLLEYFLVFSVDGVLLVDMEQRCIRAVEFPDLVIP